MNITNMLLSGQDLILPIILLALLAISAVMSFTKRSKYTQNANEMKNSLKPGDKVKTYAGMYGEIVEVKDARDGSRYVILKSGEGECVSYYSIDIEAIYGYDFKDDIEEESTSESVSGEAVESADSQEDVVAVEPKIEDASKTEEVKINGEAVDTTEAEPVKKPRKPRTTKKEN